MRFPHPVARACLTCGLPTVVAETPTGSVRVHCGTWRWQCDTLATGTPRGPAVSADNSQPDRARRSRRPEAGGISARGPLARAH